MAEPDLVELVGRCLMVGAPGPKLTPDFAALLDEHRIGNVSLFVRSTPDPERTRHLTRALRDWRGPMLIAADQEGGRVQRLVEGLVPLPSAMVLGEAGADHVEAVCEVAGRELLAVGINMNLAPVLDVNSNPANPVIGTRAFGTERGHVAACGRAAVRGYRAAGVVSCGKHFPGHGDTATDSHLELAVVEAAELEPFEAAIEEGIDSIMVGHIAVPSLDPTGTPASLSHTLTTGLLRDRLGFRGLVCTDCLEMSGAGNLEPGELAVRAFEAGSDLLLFSHTPERYVAAARTLVAAVATGRIPHQRLVESAGRVARLQGRSGPGRIDAGHRTVIVAAARAGVRVLRGADRLPLVPGRTRVITFGAGPLTEVEDERALDVFLAAALERGCSTGTGAGDRLVVATRRAAIDPDQAAAARGLRPDVLIALREPWDADAVPEAPIAIAAGGDNAPVVEAVLDLLFGPST